MSALKVAVIATPGFSPFHLSVPCILFGGAMPQQGLFDLQICTETPGEVPTSLGLSMHIAQGLEQLDSADIVIVPYWHNPAERPSQALLDKLNDRWRRGATVVGLCLGTYVLAYSGLLTGRKATTHWEFEHDFTQRFPDIVLNNNALYINDHRLITSAGTAAGIDCCLNIIRDQYGSAIANKVARRMVVSPYREGDQAQFIERPVPLSTRDGKINELMAYLRQNLDKPQDLDSLATWSNMSRRTLTRHFINATGVSLAEWLNAERLQRSQELLEMSDHNIEVVSGMSGFQSAVSFRQSFKARFKVSPSEWRRRFRGPLSIKPPAN